jgi:hypothetical protein
MAVMIENIAEANFSRADLFYLRVVNEGVGNNLDVGSIPWFHFESFMNTIIIIVVVVVVVERILVSESASFFLNSVERRQIGFEVVGF